jgi:hypothetical protein
MYNFAINKETYSSIIGWLEVLGEYDYSYEKMRIGDIKTRRLQQKALRKEEPKKDNLVSSYMDIDPKIDKEESNLNFEIIIEYVNRSYENIEDGLDNLYQTINYFIGEGNNEDSIDIFK